MYSLNSFAFRKRRAVQLWQRRCCKLSTIPKWRKIYGLNVYLRGCCVYVALSVSPPAPLHSTPACSNVKKRHKFSNAGENALHEQFATTPQLFLPLPGLRLFPVWLQISCILHSNEFLWENLLL